MEETTPVFLGRDLSRRAVLRSAMLGATALGPFGLPRIQAESDKPNKRRKLILLWQDGGPTHFETFDPKPDAPTEYRGELEAISTKLPGIAFCEVLPRLASLADRLCVIRSLHQPSSGHVDGSHNVLTGKYGETEGARSRYPDLASIITHMRTLQGETNVSLGVSTDPRLAQGMRGPGLSGQAKSGSVLPRYIDISKGIHRGGPAFLGPLHGPFQVAGDPWKPGFLVQNLQSLGSATRLLERQNLLARLDQFARSGSTEPAVHEQMRSVDGFHQQAVELLSGGAAASAFDVSREPVALRERFGLHLAGQQCLLARRLVEAGVEVVAVRFAPDGRGDYEQTMIGWDDHAVHGNIFDIMRMRGPQFDQSVSALIEDLEQRGMQDEVLVVVVGEFGRTPRIHVHKGCPGREHWGPSGCAMLYGGGLEMGQVIGSTDDKGTRPKDQPTTYQDLLATIYHAMGVNPSHTLINHVGRPTPILTQGTRIFDLTGQDHKRKRSNTLPHSAIRTNTQLRNAKLTLVLPPGANRLHLKAQDLTGAERLIAHDTQLVDDDLRQLSACTKLKQLELNNARISDRGLFHLANLKTLQSLNLTGTQVTNKGLQHLRNLTQLERFCFNGTGIDMQSVIQHIVAEQKRSLGDALLAMDLAEVDKQGNVVALNVAMTGFGDAEMKYLSHVPQLRRLHLATTEVTDGGMKHVRCLHYLEELYFPKCDIGDSGLAQVAELKQLRSLNIYGTKITSAGLKKLTGLKQLRHLLITDLKLKPADVDHLKQQLPLLKVTDYTKV